MANSEHLRILERGVKVWNHWRQTHSQIIPDLSNAQLRYANLRNADLSHSRLNQADLHKANLSYANLRNANLRDSRLSQADLHNAKLSQTDLHNAKLNSAHLFEANFYAADLRHADLQNADLRTADLRTADFNNANLNNANLYKARLSRANLHAANLRAANLRDASLLEANLRNADLSAANLRAANLHAADFSHANLSQANLSHTNLSAIQALDTVFEQIILTGACIEAWNINSATNLNGVQCDYIFLEYKDGKFTKRRPVDQTSNFGPGEFDQLISKTQKTIDLHFADSIDWKAFFRSLQDLQAQYAEDPISVQGIERKTEGLIIRLVVNADADQTSIEIKAKELYGHQLRMLDAQYEEKLGLKRESLEAARRPIERERYDKATLLGLISTLAKHQQGPQYDLKGAHFSGNFAETVKNQNPSET